MDKRTFSTVLSHASDTAFRAWATELYNELVAAGLTQTADTGQLSTPVAASRPATNTAAGYWIFAFADSLQGTAPIYLKVEVGTGGNAAIPDVVITVGTGTNGAGTLSGVVLSRAQVVLNTAPSSTVTPYPSYINHAEGFFGLVFKSGANTGGQGYLFVCRTTDSDGDPTADGYFIAAKSGGGASLARAACGLWSGFSASDSTRNWSIVPFAVTASAIGGDYQAFKVYGVYPDARVVQQLVVTIAAELTIGSETGPVEVVDGVSNNYLATGQAGTACTISSAATTYNFAMLW